jgi:hypothetical protein
LLLPILFNSPVRVNTRTENLPTKPGLQELRELRSLRHENAKLKQVVADLTLDRHILQEMSEKDLGPRAQCRLAEWAQTAYRLSQRRAARLIPVHNGTLRYRSTRDRQDALRRRLSPLIAISAYNPTNR